MQMGEVRKLTRRVTELLPFLRSHGRMVLVEPRNHVLRGIYVENSSTRGAGYVWAFVLLLCEPPPLIVKFNLGQRLGSGSRTWRVEDGGELTEKVATVGVDFWSPASSPHEFARWRKVATSQDLYVLTARALAHVLCREWDEAVLALKELHARADTDDDWVVARRKLAATLAERLAREPESVYADALAWEVANAQMLKLDPEPPFAGPARV